MEKSRDAALGSLAARLIKVAAVNNDALSATRFTPLTPDSKRLMLDTFIGRLAKTTEEKQGLHQVLEGVFLAYEKAATQAGQASDLAAALTFYLAAHYSA